MKKIILIFIGVLILHSCGKEYTRIDGTSKEVFDKSLKSVTSKLTVLQQDKMQEAIKFIYKYRTKDADEKKRWEQLYKLLDEKNAEQIFDLAEEIAKENKIVWTSTSMNTLNESVFEEDVKPLTKEEIQLQQIESATRINLRFLPVDVNKELNDGFYLYPELVNEKGETVTYANLPLEFAVSFVNNGTLVYVTKKSVTSSEVGDITKKKGIKIPYNMFDRDKLANASVDVEVKVINGDRYLYGKLTNIPIDMDKTKISNPIEKEVNEQVALDVVQTFIKEIGENNFEKAYSLTKNSKWGSIDDFSSVKNGFGGIEATNFLTTEIISSEKDRMLIFALYQVREKENKVKTLKQNFILKKLAGNWYIENTETKELKEDVWK